MNPEIKHIKPRSLDQYVTARTLWTSLACSSLNVISSIWILTQVGLSCIFGLHCHNAHQRAHTESAFQPHRMGFSVHNPSTPRRSLRARMEHWVSEAPQPTQTWSQWQFGGSGDRNCLPEVVGSRCILRQVIPAQRWHWWNGRWMQVSGSHWGPLEGLMARSPCCRSGLQTCWWWRVNKQTWLTTDNTKHSVHNWQCPYSHHYCREDDKEFNYVIYSILKLSNLIIQLSKMKS